MKLIIASVFLSIGLMFLYFSLPRHGVVVYNCTWSEISPDIPPKVKEECRKLNVEKNR